MPLLPPVERTTRQIHKSLNVLRFLRQTIYSTSDILGQVMGLTARSHIYTSLRRMEEERLITHEKFLHSITLWGITAMGQNRATQDGEDVNESVFNPSKISFINLPHYLDIQTVHVLSQHIGWERFQYVDRHRRKHLAENKTRASKIRPDLIATNPQGNIAAIEVERHIKASNRYKNEIIPGHVRNLNAKEYEFVLWITRTPAKQQELYDLFQQTVKELRTEQKWFLDVPARPFKPFQFANLETWPNY